MAQAARQAADFGSAPKKNTLRLIDSRTTPPRVNQLPGIRFTRVPPGKTLNLTRLSQTDPPLARCVWECIKRRQPDLANLLRDAGLQAMREFFDGSIILDLG